MTGTAQRPRRPAPRPEPGREQGRGSRVLGAVPGASLRASKTMFARRSRFGGMLIVAVFLVIALWLAVVQFVQAPSLSARALDQREVTEVLPATRGMIVDRTGAPIAFTMEAKSLTFQPVRVRAELDKAHEEDPSEPTTDDRLRDIADKISSVLGDEVNEDDILDQLHSDKTFVYLARSIDPGKASAITSEYHEVGSERQSIRNYPGGSLAANLVGSTGWDGHGIIGLESSLDPTLAGHDGSKVYDRGSDGVVIPGSTRDVHPASDGAKISLTIDNDAQWFVQQAVEQAAKKSGAEHVQAVVLDARTGHVLAMANNNTFNPAIGLANNPESAEFGNPSVTTPFEPGSVNKVITAVAAIENGLTTPDEVLQVPGSINMAGITVSDAWPHGLAPYTTTGVFGKSSNVGTLMLAQRVGADRYAEYLKKFGLGTPTGIGLPGESGGSVPVRSQWSGGTFANLPIGQGLSMTLLQMTSMYQALANNGVRIPPRVIASVAGGQSPVPAPEPVQVMSPDTAHTVLDMFRATIQSDTGNQRGTGSGAAVAGYQISGKTGTAQQVDPVTHAYSNSKYNITFAGIAPADDPRFVVGLMMDNPQRSSDGSGGESAAPLFKDIATFLLTRANVPLSPPAPRLILQAGG